MEMLEVVKMKEACRICGRELCGNQRRWIFHPAARVSLQVLLSHALGRQLSRDGRGEFACSKCVFVLDRMYRFDTVIARVEALSLERLHKLLVERDRLRQCIGGLYRKNNPEEGGAAPAGAQEEEPEDSAAVALQEARYSEMVQEDLTHSELESWAGAEVLVPDQHQHLLPCPDSLPAHKQRRCRGCAALRVADCDYEAVCKVPRRSTSCGPSTRYSASPPGAQDLVQASGASDFTLESSSAALDTEKSLCGGTGTGPSPASSVESLDATLGTSGPPADHKEERQEEPEEEPSKGDKPQRESPPSGPETLRGLLRGLLRGPRPVPLQGGSRIPVLLRAKLDQDLAPPPRGVPPPQQVPRQDLQAELAEMQEDWMDQYVSCDALDLRRKQLVTSDLSQVLTTSWLLTDKPCSSSLSPCCSAVS